MTKFMTLACAAAITLGLGACTSTSHPTDLPPGEYHSSTKSTNSAGTNYKKDTTTNVEVDQYGNKRATVETETTKDPEGLFNKETTTKKTTYK